VVSGTDQKKGLKVTVLKGKSAKSFKLPHNPNKILLTLINNTFSWDANGVAAGTYLCRLRAKEELRSKRVMVVK